MRKLLWCSLLTLGAAALSSAQTDERLAQHELRWDAFALLSKGQLDLSYECVSDHPLSFGVTAAFLVNGKKSDDFESENHTHLAKWHAGPYVRYRLSQSRKTYYFVEANTLYNAGDYRYIATETTNGISTYRSSIDGYQDLAVGGAIGFKWMFSDNWGAELSAGTGWNLLNTDKSPELLTRVGVRLAYRF